MHQAGLDDLCLKPYPQNPAGTCAFVRRQLHPQLFVSGCSHPCALRLVCQLLHASPCVQDLRGVKIHPAEAALLARSLPAVQLSLDGLDTPWQPHWCYPPRLRELEGDDWGQAEDDE